MFTHTNTHQTNEKYEVYKSALRRKLENRSGKTNNTDRHKHKHTPKDAHLALSAVSAQSARNRGSDNEGNSEEGSLLCDIVCK